MADAARAAGRRANMFLIKYGMLYAIGCLRTIYGMGRGLFFR